MADAASLETEIQNFATLVSGQFKNTNAKLDYMLSAEGARFDALSAALQVMHGAVLDGAEGKPVDFAAMAKVLEGAQVTLTKIQEGAPA